MGVWRIIHVQTNYEAMAGRDLSEPSRMHPFRVLHTYVAGTGLLPKNLHTYWIQLVGWCDLVASVS